MMYVKEKQRIVVKVGTSTLTHATGHLNLRRIEALVKVISDMKNAGHQMVLVSSGAVSAGVAKVGLGHIPETPEEKQAMAAIGQSELMKLYDRFFSDYGHTVAQMLLTKDVVENPMRRAAAENTFRRLLDMNCIPIVNENDSVSTDELTKFGGNDMLSAHVACVCDADLVLNLSDVDGLYDSDPRKNPDARLIGRVERIEDVLSSAGGAGTSRGTGGMMAKLRAAQITTSQGIPMFILNGHDPEILYTLMDGGHVGTYFVADEAKAEDRKRRHAYDR
ncbi:MAG: glutamate 5-kinase [Ruminococcaceae bacterium]|nr:glutamate 5-kinase [Oscillospiraceae bacterium]